MEGDGIMVDKEIQEFEERKVETLLSFGCPKEELWLTECTTTLDALRFYGAFIFELNPKNQPYCLYYHENGSLCSFASFETEKEFQQAAKYIANYLKG